MGIHEEIQQKKFRSAQKEMFVNVMFTANWLDGEMRKLFKPFGITQQQYNVLRILRGSHPEPLSAMNIKCRMIDRSPDLTRLIDRLLEKGLVNRRTCPNNRRQVEIGIEAKGIKLIEQIDPALNAKMAAFGVIGDDEAKQVSHLLDKLRDEYKEA